MTAIPEQYLVLAEYARNIFAADEPARMAVVVKTAPGSVLGFPALAEGLDPSFDRAAEEERFLQTLTSKGQKKLRQGLCMTRGGELDIPSASLREKLEALDPANLEAEFFFAEAPDITSERWAPWAQGRKRTCKGRSQVQ